MLDNHVLPRFGSMKLDGLNRPMIEKWLVDLPLSNQTKNHCLYMMRNILREAAAEGIIKANPLENAEPMGKNGRKRDVFTLEELRLLFPGTREGLISVWKTPKYSALFLAMVSSGIREGHGRYDGGTSFPADGSRWNLRSRKTVLVSTIDYVGQMSHFPSLSCLRLWKFSVPSCCSS
jgi:hypothetical protein